MSSLILSLSSGLVGADHQGHNFVNDSLKVKSLSLILNFVDDLLVTSHCIRAEKEMEKLMVLSYLKSISYLIVFISVSIKWVAVIRMIFVQKFAQVLLP